MLKLVYCFLMFEFMHKCKFELEVSPLNSTFIAKTYNIRTMLKKTIGSLLCPNQYKFQVLQHIFLPMGLWGLNTAFEAYYNLRFHNFPAPCGRLTVFTFKCQKTPLSALHPKATHYILNGFFFFHYGVLVL